MYISHINENKEIQTNDKIRNIMKYLVTVKCI